MAISNIKVPTLKAPTFKSVDFRVKAPVIGSVKTPNTNISVKAPRPAKITIKNKI